MKLGAYDQRIQFISFGQVSDGAGGYTPVEEVLLTTLARFDQLKQSGSLEKVLMGLPTAYRLGIMVRSGFEIKVGMLVKWKDVVYKVLNAPTVVSVRYQKEWVFDISE